MRASDAVRTLVVIGAMLIIGILVIGQLFMTAPGVQEVTVEAEEIEVDYGVEQSLAESDAIVTLYEDEEVRASDGTVLTEGEDYVMDYENATIEFLDTAETTDGETAEIDYTYESRSDMMLAIIGPVIAAFELGAVLPIVIVAVALLAGLSGFGGSGGSRGRR